MTNDELAAHFARMHQAAERRTRAALRRVVHDAKKRADILETQRADIERELEEVKAVFEAATEKLAKSEALLRAAAEEARAAEAKG